MDSRQQHEFFPGGERFQIGRQLGSGGSGAVFEAFDREENRKIALKTLKSDDVDRVLEFKEEFFTLKGLEHPNFVRLYELFNEDSRWFFTMELVEGSDIITYVRNPTSGFDESRLRHCFVQLVSAVYQLHCQGLIHRDIKPSNTMITEEGRLVLLDFGLATEVIAGRQVDGIAAVGTRHYIAPEQSFGFSVGASADWYSVGVILYQALTGQLPSQLPNTVAYSKATSDKNWLDVLPPAVLNPSVPEDLNDLCAGMLRIVPEERLRGRQIVDLLGLSEESFQKTDKPGAEWHRASLEFVGRKKELLVLREALERAKSKTESVVIVGEPGIGKSALAGEFIERLEDDTAYLILRGRFSLGASVRFQAFKSIFDDVKNALKKFFQGKVSRISEEKIPVYISPLSMEEATAVAQIFPRLMNVEIVAEQVNPLLRIPHPQELRAKAYRAVRKLFQTLNQKYQIVIFLDDLQWADSDSLSLLTDIINSAQSPPLLLITTLRNDCLEHGELDRILPHAIRLPLEGLQLSEARKLSRSIAALHRARDFDPIENERLLQEARGHPLFLAELVQYKVTMTSELAVGGLEEAIWSRILRLEKNALKLLEIICVSVIPLDEEIVAEIAGLERAQWVPALASLLVGFFIQSTGQAGETKIEPYHDRIRETMLAHLEPERLRHYHLQLAHELDLGSTLVDKEVVVKHLEAAGRYQQAADLAQKASFMATKQLAFGKTADLISTSLRLGEYTPDERLKMQMDLGDALCNAGRGDKAYKVYLDAGQRADPATRLDCYRRAIEQLMINGHFDEGYRQIDNLLFEVGASLPKSTRGALFSLIKNRARLSIRGTGWRRREPHQIPADRLAELDIYAAVAGGLAMMDNVRGADFQTRCLALALKLGEEKRLCHAMTMETIFLASQGATSGDRVSRMLAEASEIAQKTDEPFLRWGVVTARGAVRYFQARFPEACIHFTASESGFRTRSEAPRYAINSNRILLVSSLRILCCFKELMEAYNDYVWDSQQRGDRFFETSIRLLCSRIFLVNNAIEDGFHNLSEAVWLPPAGGYHLITWYQLVTSIELALYLGTADEQLETFDSMFEELYDSMLLRIITIKLEAYWLRGRLLLATLGNKSHGRAAWNQLKKIVRKMEIDLGHLPPAKGWAALLSAAMEFSRGNTERAQELLQLGMDMAHACDQRFLAESAKRRLGEIKGGDEGLRLVRESEIWMNGQGVVDPARMVDVFIPALKEISPQ